MYIAYNKKKEEWWNYQGTLELTYFNEVVYVSSWMWINMLGFNKQKETCIKNLTHNFEEEEKERKYVHHQFIFMFNIMSFEIVFKLALS